VTSSCSVDKGDSSFDSGSGEAESVLIFLFGGSIVVDVGLLLEGGRSLVSGDRQSCDGAYTRTHIHNGVAKACGFEYSDVEFGY
jgi:hypothetical protein